MNARDRLFLIGSVRGARPASAGITATARVICLLLAVSVNALAHAQPLTHGSVGPGHGLDLPGGDAVRDGVLHMNYDGSAENGCCWEYSGVRPPCYDDRGRAVSAGMYLVRMVSDPDVRSSRVTLVR